MDLPHREDLWLGQIVFFDKRAARGSRHLYDASQRDPQVGYEFVQLFVLFD